jgi:hypothetical protein
MVMPLPTFAPTKAEPKYETLSRTVAAARLEIHVAHVDKMLRAEMLPLPITAASVDELLGRPKLRVMEGELTVLRTDARRPADSTKYPHDGRRWMGFHVDHTDAELAETSLRWWRSDPSRVEDNELFVVTVATFPVAVYRITGQEKSFTPRDEDSPRQHYNGKLLARVGRGMVPGPREPMPGYLRPLVHQIMSSRISVNSGGPIGYLEPQSPWAGTTS